uniref:HPS4 biogenesis of lysosomal organelles complex 3 subunit 2 n=1 Tax=Cyprinus carpio carpio TaxID=630221 RepID=A0A8C1D0I7_CYPCA
MQPMAETAALAYSRRFFFLYDSSKVQEEEDRTREGIYYFSPEDALSCVVDIPDVSVCDLLDQLIALFCFYNGPVRQSYQLYSKEDLALRWARYLCHLQGGSTELHNIFSCVRTIDSTHIDPLLLLKAALILQACQRCPLVLAGCILYRGRVVSTQMTPALTMKVMVYETQTYSQDFRVTANGLSSSVGSPSSFTATTQVFLTPTELYMLRCHPVDRACRSHCSQPPCQPSKSRFLSRTLSDTPTTDTDSSSLDPTQCPPVSYQTMPSSPRSSLSDEPYFSPIPSRVNTPLHSNLMNQSEYFTPDSHDHGTLNGTNLCAVKESLAGLNIKQDTDASSGSETKSEGLNSDPDTQSDEIKALANGYEQSNCLDNHPDHDNQIQNEENKLDANNHVANKNGKFQGETEEEARTKSKQVEGRLKEKYEPRNTPSPHETLADTSLVPSVLYQHRVRGLVLALLVEPEFNTDPTAREEVHHSSMASLNGLEAHLRNTSPGTPGTPGPPGPYTFAHYDCIQNTLTTNVCGRSAGPQEAFVRATKLLHSHFSHLDTLQEAIVRNGSSAVYGTRSMAQETYFLQQGTPVRNSGSPDPQDSAFSLPRKARQRLLKHGVNLL